MKLKFYIGCFFLFFGCLENFGNIYVNLFFEDYILEFFPKDNYKDDLIYFFVKKVPNYKFIKLGIFEWKMF